MADCDPAYDLVSHDFRPFTCCRARSRPQQLILFSLDVRSYALLKAFRDVFAARLRELGLQRRRI